MLKDHFTDKEIAEEIGVDVGTANDLLAGKGEWLIEDVDRLIAKLVKKLMAKANSA